MVDQGKSRASSNWDYCNPEYLLLSTKSTDSFKRDFPRYALYILTLKW